ncbi:hypothetical protein [Nitrosopumilus sp.]|uniref:hypothetical protein n=1 Tax=Nitrosopumilus sp. TaxID=2024843 RepID=UPI00247C1F0A|nr:hypothetical protein [Nitrosopumilus sp.]MCV0409630.1 hypothetical protein [Nitrosopumilus sp.]
MNFKFFLFTVAVLFTLVFVTAHPVFAEPIDDTHGISYGQVGTAVSLNTHIQNPYDFPVSASIEFVFEDIDSGNHWDAKKHTGTADANSSFVTHQSYFFKNTGRFLIHFVYEVDGKPIKEPETTEFIIFKEYSDVALNGCSPDHKFIIKPNYGTAVCVFDETVEKLVKRGWVDNNITEMKHDSENDAPTFQISFDILGDFNFPDNFYFIDDEIKVSGNIWTLQKENFDETPVIIQVNYDDELIEIAQVPVSSDGTFSHSIKAAGPLWQQSGLYLITVSYDSVTTQQSFGFSTYYDDVSVNYFVNSDSDDYEELCGYPVTDEMRLDIIKNSWVSYGVPYLTSQQGNFTHVERSKYLTDIPDLQYWFVLKSGKQVYFEIGACDIDDSNITLGEIGPNYEKSQDIIVDGIHYTVLPAPGSPLIYNDTLLPVLDIDNCKRVADNYTKEERPKLFTRETTTFDAAWANQVFPLMDYCTGIGNYELKTIDGNINWSFTEK